MSSTSVAARPNEMELTGPAVEVAKQPLRIVFATDGAVEAKEAQDVLALLPLCPGSSIQVVTVMEAGMVEMAPIFTETGYEWARGTGQEARAALKREGVDVTCEIRVGPRAREVIEAAEDYGADLLVLGASEHSLMEAFFLGAISSNVAKHARCSVLLARKPKRNFHRVVLAVDKSEHSRQAVEMLAKLPLQAHTRIAVVHIIQPYHPFPPMYVADPVGFQDATESGRIALLNAAQALTLQVADQLQAAGKDAYTVVLEGDPASEIRSVVEEADADLLVMGARGVSLIEGLVVGSVADRLLKSAHCSILVTR